MCLEGELEKKEQNIKEKRDETMGIKTLYFG